MPHDAEQSMSLKFKGEHFSYPLSFCCSVLQVCSSQSYFRMLLLLCCCAERRNETSLLKRECDSL